MSRVDRERVAAVRTLERMGFTYHGGDLWKPPLGSAPVGLGDCSFTLARDPSYSASASNVPAVGYCTTHRSFICSKTAGSPTASVAEQR